MDNFFAADRKEILDLFENDSMNVMPQTIIGAHLLTEGKTIVLMSKGTPVSFAHIERGEIVEE